MKTPEDIIRKVLEQYEGSQINLDSPAARDLLTKHIVAAIEDDKDRNFWANLDQGQQYNVKPSDYTDTDMSL
jgi:hypothetical protein